MPFQALRTTSNYCCVAHFPETAIREFGRERHCGIRPPVLAPNLQPAISNQKKQCSARTVAVIILQLPIHLTIKSLSEKSLCKDSPGSYPF